MLFRSFSLKNFPERDLYVLDNILFYAILVTSQKLGVFVALRSHGNTVASIHITSIWSKVLPIIVPHDIPLKNIQDMAYGTSEITTYGIFKMTYGVISAGLPERVWITKRNIYPDFLRSYPCFS
jgi:hypothetical protein